MKSAEHENKEDQGHEVMRGAVFLQGDKKNLYR